VEQNPVGGGASLGFTGNRYVVSELASVSEEEAYDA
jgi:hypothetical protein